MLKTLLFSSLISFVFAAQSQELPEYLDFEPGLWVFDVEVKAEHFLLSDETSKNQYRQCITDNAIEKALTAKLAGSQTCEMFETNFKENSLKAELSCPTQEGEVEGTLDLRLAFDELKGDLMIKKPGLFSPKYLINVKGKKLADC